VNNSPYGQESKRTRINRQVANYKLVRTTYEGHWRTIADYLSPYRLRMNLSDWNKGDRRNLNIYDSTATQDLRTLAAGMMAYITSPASQWVRFTTDDPDLAEFGPVKDWMGWAEERLSQEFVRSSLYSVLPGFYEDMAAFGTAVMYLETDSKQTIYARQPLTGSYWLGVDNRNVANGYYEELRPTVRQLYQEFWANGTDGDNISAHVKSLAEAGDWETWVDVGHIVYPNESYDKSRLSSKYKKFSSCYYELGMSGASDKSGYATNPEGDVFLRESGYDRFPVLCGRWKAIHGEVYGVDCPGMLAIGDIKGLQKGEQRSFQAIDKKVAPHWLAPAELEGKGNGWLPNETTYVSSVEGLKQLRPAHSPDLSIAELEGKQKQIRGRIHEALHATLFKMLQYLDDRTRTATEIEARKEEKLVQLSPMIEQLETSVFIPLVDTYFDAMWAQGDFADYPPPEELRRAGSFDVEFLGILSQARKKMQVAPIERVLTFAAQASQFAPDILDNINTDEAIEHYADRLAIPSQIMRSPEEREAIRQARAKQIQQQQAAERIPAMAKTAKDLSETSMEGDTALSRVAGALSEAAGAVPGR